MERSDRCFVEGDTCHDIDNGIDKKDGASERVVSVAKNRHFPGLGVRAWANSHTVSLALRHFTSRVHSLSLHHFPFCTNTFLHRLDVQSFHLNMVRRGCFSGMAYGISDILSRRRRATWKRWMRRSMAHLQWISMNQCLSEIVRDCYLRPLVIFSLSVSQMRPLLANICQIWVTMSRSSESLLGSLLAGRSLKRSSPVRSLTAVDIAGEHQVHLHPCISSSPLGRRRRILLFPFGNSNAPPNDTVSVYLDYADPKRAPEGWHVCAQFALVISNPHDPTIYTVSRTCSDQYKVL